MATIDFNYKQQELANHFLNLNENSELYFKILDLDPDTGYPNELGPLIYFHIILEMLEIKVNYGTLF